MPFFQAAMKAAKKTAAVFGVVLLALFVWLLLEWSLGRITFYSGFARTH